MMNADIQRKEVLQLLATGKITVGEAAELLAATGKNMKVEDLGDIPAIKAEVAESNVGKTPDTISNSRAKWLHVKVKDLDSGEDKMTVNIPMRMVQFGLSLGRRFVPELDGSDFEMLANSLDDQSGLLVDVRDNEDGEHVQIYID
jgi:hypothetical protein